MKIIDLFNSNNLIKIISNFSIEEVIHALSFNDTLRLSWRMLFKDYGNIEQNEFGVQLLFSLKTQKPIEWDSDWRNDALLAVACDTTYRYDERYKFFKSAYDRAKSTGEENHPGLLLALARCCHAPGTPLISYEDSLDLALTAIRDKIYLDGAWALSGIYSSLNDEMNHKKWKSIAEKLEKENGEISPHFYPQCIWDKEIISSE